MQLCRQLIVMCMPLRRLNLKPVMHNETACQVSSLLTLLDGALLSAPALADPAAAAAHAERTFVFCLAWSLGGLLPEADRAPFDAELRAISPATMPPKVGGLHALLAMISATALVGTSTCLRHLVHSNKNLALMLKAR